jgi:hypothetical protein
MSRQEPPTQVWAHRASCTIRRLLGYNAAVMNMPTAIKVIALAALIVGSCGSDGTEADRKGVGAQCASANQCGDNQECLPFRGGYCGLRGCTADAMCPAGSACVQHTDGSNYCFRICVDKVDCNRNRSVDNEANCSSNVTFVEAASTRKACVPPASAT